MIVYSSAGQLWKNVERYWKFWICMRWLWDKRLIGATHHYFLAKTLPLMWSMKSKWLWVFQKLCNMRDIRGSCCLWGKVKNPALATLRKGCGGSCKGGKGNYYLKLVGRYCWKQSSKLFQPTLWGVLNYPLVCAMKLKC